MTAPFNMQNLGLCLRTWASDVRKGSIEIIRHGLAILGLMIVLASLGFMTKDSWQATVSERLNDWLQIPQNELQPSPAVISAATRSTTQNLQNLTQDQAQVTQWLSRKYRVSTEPMGAMVAEAWSLGERYQLAPSLILAIMAIESRFNPFASGSQGSAGLMQLEIKAHAEALGQYGGPLSAFDPLTNVRVGVLHLQSLLVQTTSLEEALALYGTSSGQRIDSLYVDRVLAEQKLLDKLTQKQNTAALATQGDPQGL